MTEGRKSRRFGAKATVSWALSLSLAVAGCGGSGDGTPPTLSGRLVDSPVQGVGYVCGELRGETDAEGGFLYREGTPILFHVGDIILGEVLPQPILTPVDLVAGAIDESHPTVINIARFLQTIDDDADPRNGIQIPSDVAAAAEAMALDFRQSLEEFASDSSVQAAIRDLTSLLQGGLRPLIGADPARDHLRDTLTGLLAGSYTGTYSGGDSGTWEVTVTEGGVVSGTGRSSIDLESFTIDGEVQTSGSLELRGVVGSTDDCAIFTGTVTLWGTFSGRWWNLCDGTSGRFQGRKTATD